MFTNKLLQYLFKSVIFIIDRKVLFWAGRKILVQPNGRGFSPPFFCGESIMILSIFVDESGDFGQYEKHCPFYIVTMVFHNQNVDLSDQIKMLDRDLSGMGYGNIAIHTEPLIRREEIYTNVDPNERRSLFSRLYGFVMHSDIRYKTFLYEKIHYTDDMKLEARMAKDISTFLRNNLDFFLSFEKVIVYYDNGQRQITRMLNAVMATELTNFEVRRVQPVNYRLFQAADLLCTLKLLEKRYEANTLTRSDYLLFHSRKDLRKDFLKKIKEKEFDS